MSAIAFCSAAASSSGEPPAAALASSRGKEEEGGSHSHGNRCGAASGTPWTAEKSHSSASTSRGPGLLAARGVWVWGWEGGPSPARMGPAAPVEHRVAVDKHNAPLADLVRSGR